MRNFIADSLKKLANLVPGTTIAAFLFGIAAVIYAEDDIEFTKDFENAIKKSMKRTEEKMKKRKAESEN